MSWDVHRNISLFFTGFLEMIFMKCARTRESLSGILYFSETSLKIKTVTSWVNNVGMFLYLLYIYIYTSMI